MPSPKYVPIPSLGHELGVMFGFIAFMFICAIVYYFSWQSFQKKVIKIEEDRRTALGSTPLYSGKYNEKGREKAEYVEDTGEKDGRRPPRSAAFQGVMMNDVM